MANTKDTILTLADITRVMMQIKTWILSRISHIEESEEVTAEALTDLNTRLEAVEQRLDTIEEVLANALTDLNARTESTNQ